MNPATEENPLWYGVVLFKDLELGIGIFFGVYFKYVESVGNGESFAHPEHPSPIKYK